jgi:1-pyrroline-5-carboxylate dehydrogenase
MNDLPRVTYSNTGEDFSGVHAYLDEIIPRTEARLFGNIRPALIGGQDRAEGVTVTARSPIDYGIHLGEFPQAGEGLVEDAVEAARSAHPGWRAMGWPRRVAILRAAADMVEERKWKITPRSGW